MQEWWHIFSWDGKTRVLHWKSRFTHVMGICWLLLWYHFSFFSFLQQPLVFFPLETCSTLLSYAANMEWAHFRFKPMYPIPWVRQLVPGSASGWIQATEREKIPFAGCSWERAFLFLLWEVGEEVLFQCGGRSKVWSNCYYEGSWVEPRESKRSQSLVTLWSSGKNQA